jgi:hypothetical protein
VVARQAMNLTSSVAGNGREGRHAHLLCAPRRGRAAIWPHIPPRLYLRHPPPAAFSTRRRHRQTHPTATHGVTTDATGAASPRCHPPAARHPRQRCARSTRCWARSVGHQLLENAPRGDSAGIAPRRSGPTARAATLARDSQSTSGTAPTHGFRRADQQDCPAPSVKRPGWTWRTAGRMLPRFHAGDC